MPKKKQSPLQMVLLRNLYYRDAFKRVVICVLLLVLIDAALIGGIIYKSSTPPTPKYFAATPDGRIIPEHPLTDPVLSNDQVLAWVAMVTRTLYRRDYIHWQAQLQQASDYFTPPGWRSFSSNLQRSNNLKTLTAFKMVNSVEITGVPTLLRKGIISGHYAWVIKVPVLVRYLSPIHATINQSLDITFIVIRMPVQDYPDRIAIHDFLPQTSGG